MVNVKYTKNSYRPLKGSLVGGPYKTSLGSTLTLTCSPLESKIGSGESEKCKLMKNTCLIRKVNFIQSGK